MSNEKVDILVLGATGFTGGLTVRYLATHPQRQHFSLAIGGRNAKKLEEVVKKLNLASDVKLVQADATKDEEAERAVKGAKVVVNCVGPYWLYGTATVRACARNGVHYVDLTAEPPWTRRMILEYDYLATKTGAIIVPSCGFDSIPSDSTAYLSNKTLKSLPSSTGLPLYAGTSTTVHNFNGGISGGTISTALTILEEIPHSDIKFAAKQYSLSPFVGKKQGGLGFKYLYKLVVPGLPRKNYIGGFFFMSPANRSLVQRTFGLFELHAAQSGDLESKKRSYGPDFVYDEFMQTNSVLKAFVIGTSFVIAFTLLAFKPFRVLLKSMFPPAGSGPSEEKMEKGWFSATNLTVSTSNPPVYVKSVIKGKGDPGYSTTAVMISECALSILLPPVSSTSSQSNLSRSGNNIHALGPIAKRGGILTPMTAFGDVLIQRMEETGSFQFSSSVVGDKRKDD
ncbi:Saccharopine dehydrogenase-domain-containing protein [Crepidotus variabilis]|uniref:Saccharopine dehydrogenase-domain-containing protein n=1 Tax=Crepidotus variabilis TaxID=179855 RepID=A0A9P6JRB8_9AGAR|nr:Saccharopine dehydrogenase-domain-containing protein [Crepidotus variabilis]